MQTGDMLDHNLIIVTAQPHNPAIPVRIATPAIGEPASQLRVTLIVPAVQVMARLMSADQSKLLAEMYTDLIAMATESHVSREQSRPIFRPVTWLQNVSQVIDFVWRMQNSSPSGPTSSKTVLVRIPGGHVFTMPVGALLLRTSLRRRGFRWRSCGTCRVGRKWT